ncbi:MAG: VCBS repeat-containing protein, partial [Bryobacteraceae bacterium]
MVALLTTVGGFGQTSNGVAPGDWLQFRADRKLTGRTRLAGGISGPGQILWRQFIGARQTSVAFRSDAASGSVAIGLPSSDSNAGTLAANATWGIGPAAYDLNHDSRLTTFGIDTTTKIGNFVAGSTDFQKVEFASAFSSCGNNASACSEYGHFYKWQNGNWVEQWKTNPIPALFQANTIVGDFDNDGRLDVAAEPWDNIQVYDLLNGQMKTTAQFKPSGAESGRGYGWLGAFDLNGNGTQEIIALGTFQNMIAVMGWQNGNLVKLWDHLIEASTSARQTVHVTGASPVQDIDGDGKPDIVTSIYNETGDGQWHVVARDGMTGTVILDQPRQFLLGMTNVDDAPGAELFTIATAGLLTPEYGQVDIVSFRGRTMKILLEQDGVALSTRPVESLPLNVNTGDSHTTIVAGPVAQGGFPVFFTRKITDSLAGIVEVTGWQWKDGHFLNVATVSGPRLQAVATRIAAQGTPEFLTTASVSGKSGGTILANGASGTIVRSRLLVAPRSSVVVGHLTPGETPTVVVQDAQEQAVAFRPSSKTGGGTVLWTHSGRGGNFGADNYNGQYGYSGLLLASLTGNGTLQTIVQTRGPAGQARIVAIQPDGKDLWTSDLNQFPGAPPEWNQAGVTLSIAGRFRFSDREDIVAGTRRGAQGSEELNLLDGRTGQLQWTKVNGNTPGSSFNQRGAGMGWMAVYDWNNDGLDEIINTQTDVFWVADGTGRNLIDRDFNKGVFSNVWTFYGVPVVADFLGNGTNTILYGGTTYLLGLIDPSAKAIWNGSLQSGTPGFLQGIADVEGDKTLTLLSAGATANGQSVLSAQRGSTGETLWSVPLSGCGTFGPNNNPTNNAPTPVTVGDIDGDGREEGVFACGSKIFVAGADTGNRSGKILWSLDLGTLLGTPILADAEGTGRLQIVVVGSDGNVYGVGSPGPNVVGSLAHITSAGTWKFTLDMVNLGTTATQAQMNFIDNNGNLMSLPLLFPQSAGTDAVLASTIDRTLAPGAQVVATSTGPDDATA